MQISFAVPAKLISALVFDRHIDSTIPVLPKSEISSSSYHPWLYSPVCVGPGRKPRRPVFSQRGSYNNQMPFNQTFKVWQMTIICSVPYKKQANSENLCPPPRFFLRNKESSEKVKFIRGVTLTRYILFTYVDSNNA